MEHGAGRKDLQMAEAERAAEGSLRRPTARPAVEKYVNDEMPEPPPQPTPVLVATEPEMSVRELEQRFFVSRGKDAQIEVLREIAGHNDADAVQALARIFSGARDAEVKEALLASLSDVDPEAAPSARLTVLEQALVGQARNVRLTAIDALGQSEDPRALKALRRAAKEDPDKLLREAAAAILETAGQ